MSLTSRIRARIGKLDDQLRKVADGSQDAKRWQAERRRWASALKAIEEDRDGDPGDH